MTASLCSNQLGLFSLCSVDGCERPVFERAPRKGLCPPHYWQKQRGAPLGPIRVRRRPGDPQIKCSVEGCDGVQGPKSGRGMCQMHYLKWSEARRERCHIPGCSRSRSSKDGLCTQHKRRQDAGGDMSVPLKPSIWRNKGNVCRFDSCEKDAVSNGYCGSHASQLYRGDGQVRRVRSIHDGVGYAAAHHRVARLWGSATDHQCIECEKPAAHWAYDGTDPLELTETEHKGRVGVTSVLPYSRYPEFYMPMCAKHHKNLDAKRARAAFAEFRDWLKNKKERACLEDTA